MGVVSTLKHILTSVEIYAGGGRDRLKGTANIIQVTYTRRSSAVLPLARNYGTFGGQVSELPFPALMRCLRFVIWI